MDQNSGQSPKTICVGKIAGAHGVKGLAKILPYCEDVSLLEQALNYTITLKNSNGKHMLAEIKDVQTREDVEKLKGTELFVSRDVLPDIDDEDTYYIEDLIGMAVVDKSGDEIGIVRAVPDYGGGELLDIRLKNGKELLLPFKDEYVPSVTEVITVQDYEEFVV